MISCRYCAAPAAVVVALDQGDFCYPDDREQALCIQHIIRAIPVHTMQVWRVLLPDALRAYNVWQNRGSA